MRQTQEARIVAGNRAVVYQGPGKVSVESVDYPELVLKPGPGVPPANENRKCPHGVILKVVASNICGSDQHMVRGRTTAPMGLILGHEITVDCVGFEAKGHTKDGQQEAPATVLNAAMEITRAGGGIGIPGLYVTEDPGASDPNARLGSLSLRLGLGWAKSNSFATGQCPVLRYNRALMTAILHDRVQIARNVNATVISLDAAPDGYAEFDSGVPKKFVLDPHGMLGAA